MGSHREEAGLSSRRPATVGSAFLREAPGGLTSYPPLAGLLGIRPARLATRIDEAAKEGPVTSGRLAGTTRLQPPQAGCVTPRDCSHRTRIRTSSTPRDVALIRIEREGI